MFKTIYPTSFTTKIFNTNNIQQQTKPKLFFQGDLFTRKDDNSQELTKLNLLLRQLTTYAFKLNSFRQLAIAYKSAPAKQILNKFDEQINLESIYTDIENISLSLQKLDGQDSKQALNSLESVKAMKKSQNIPTSINREYANDTDYNLKSLLREVKEIANSLNHISVMKKPLSKELQSAFNKYKEHTSPTKIQIIADFTQQLYDKHLDL